MANKEELRKEGIEFLNYVCKQIYENGELPFEDETFDHYYLKAMKDPAAMTEKQFKDFSITNYYFCLGVYLDILDSDYNKYILDFERRSLKIGTIIYNTCIKEYGIFNDNLKQSMINMFERIKELPTDKDNVKEYIESLREDIIIKDNYITFGVGLNNLKEVSKQKDTVYSLLNDEETQSNFVDLCKITLENVAILKAIEIVRNIFVDEFNLENIREYEKPTDLTTFQTTKKGIETLFDICITEDPKKLEESEIGKYLKDFTNIKDIEISEKQKNRLKEQITADKEQYISYLLFEKPEKNLYHFRLANKLIKGMGW